MVSKSSLLRPWRTLGSTVAYNHRIQVLEDQVSPPDRDMFVYVYVRGVHDIVAILALTDDRQVLLAQEYRHPLRKIIDNLPSGSIPDGEVPSQAARRELVEETGYTAHQLTPLGRMTPFPGITAGTIHLFLAQGLQPTAPHFDAHEYIRIERMDVDDVLQRVLRGEFEDGALQLAVLRAAQQGLLEPTRHGSH